MLRKGKLPASAHVEQTSSVKCTGHGGFGLNKVMKSVQQRYVPNAEVLWLLEQFRMMLNECTRIGLTENVTSLSQIQGDTNHVPQI